MFYPPCNDAELMFVRMNFQRNFGMAVPEAYEQLLGKSNGLSARSGVIWPGVVKEETKMLGTIFSANRKLHRQGADRYVFFGRTTDGWLTYDRRQRCFTAVERVNFFLIEHFDSCQAMLLSVLSSPNLPTPQTTPSENTGRSRSTARWPCPPTPARPAPV